MTDNVRPDPGPIAVFDDTPRAIPAANPFNPLPEEPWIGEAAQHYREVLIAEKRAPEVIEPMVRAFVVETLKVPEPEHVPLTPDTEIEEPSDG